LEGLMNTQFSKKIFADKDGLYMSCPEAVENTQLNIDKFKL